MSETKEKAIEPSRKVVRIDFKGDGSVVIGYFDDDKLLDTFESPTIPKRLEFFETQWLKAKDKSSKKPIS